MTSKTEENKLNLNELKRAVTWDSLALTHHDTIVDINSQIALVVELREQYQNRMSKDISLAFDGLLLSFKDLIRETIIIGLSHANKTTTDKTTDDHVEYATEFYTGKLEDDDQAMEYINLGSKYMNVQDKTISLISMGWVDLFTKLKLPTDTLNEVIKTSSKEAGVKTNE